MKTKRVELKKWIYYENDNDFRVYITEDQYRNVNSVPCTISFEIPIPERKVEISESDLEKEYEIFLNDQERFSKKMAFKDYLKQKLFGSEAE